VSGEVRRRPASVTVAVVIMYLGGVAQIALGIVTIFLRYTPEAESEGIVLAVSLFGVAMILFGLFVIALASGVARGSRASRIGATVVLTLALVVAIVDLLVAADGDWSGVAIQSVASAGVILPLWITTGRRYFATR